MCVCLCVDVRACVFAYPGAQQKDKHVYFSSGHPCQSRDMTLCGGSGRYPAAGSRGASRGTARPTGRKEAAPQIGTVAAAIDSLFVSATARGFMPPCQETPCRSGRGVIINFGA
eukprot:GHVU01040703.1.p2 GENE.GHVU01040703.1~~GHVU01040703.1.p2  ORF type:complete len:114 (+),score=4.50 GHVU01040703.1:398-739(+)